MYVRILGKYKAAVTIIDRNKQIMSSSAPYNRDSALRLGYHLFYILYAVAIQYVCTV